MKTIKTIFDANTNRFENVEVDVYQTAEEIESIKTILRGHRNEECFTIINRGQLWYNTLSEEQLNELNTWYIAWLEVTETLTPPIKPLWIKIN